MIGNEVLKLADVLHEKIQQIIRIQQGLLQRVEWLEDENARLRQQSQIQTHELSELNFNKQIHNLTNSLTQGKENAEVRDAINQIVREIDRCISVINQPDLKL